MENLTSLAGSIKLRTGKRPETLHIDLADISQTTLAAKKMRDDGTPLDILINNGAQWLPGAMDSHDAYAIANTITGNVTGTLLFTRGLLPLLAKSGKAHPEHRATSGSQCPLLGASVATSPQTARAGLTDALRQDCAEGPCA
jgi:short-subunit dehydrogenase